MHILVDPAVPAVNPLLTKRRLKSSKAWGPENTSPPPAFPWRLRERFGIILHIHVDHDRASAQYDA